MTEDEIKNYFNQHKIYKYAGTINELELKMQTALISFNTLRVSDNIYFVCQNEEDPTVINDDKLSVFYIPEIIIPEII
jgi:hypothetical protein